MDPYNIVFLVGGILAGGILSYWTAYKHAVKGRYDAEYRRGWRAGYDHHLQVKDRNETQREHIRETRIKRNMPFISVVPTGAK